MLNSCIRDATGPGFTAKDIRTWARSLKAVEYLVRDSKSDEGSNTKSVAGMLDWVSSKLGNTRNVCKKYYVHPLLTTFCEEKRKMEELKPPAVQPKDFNKYELLPMSLPKHN